MSQPLLRLVPLAALLAASPAAAGGDLAASLGAAIDLSPLAAARSSILVEAVDTGEVVFARDPDVLLNPASNVKLVTTAAALARLGPDYRFATEFLVDAAPARGAARALYVRGKGDPTLVTERLWAVTATSGTWASARSTSWCSTTATSTPSGTAPASTRRRATGPTSPPPVRSP